MTPEELAHLWESYLRLPLGSLGAKAPAQPPPAPLSGLDGWSSEIYNDTGKVVAHVQAIPKATFKVPRNPAPAPVPPAAIALLGTAPRRIIR